MDFGVSLIHSVSKVILFYISSVRGLKKILGMNTEIGCHFCDDRRQIDDEGMEMYETETDE
jgi:hypothetical protein